MTLRFGFHKLFSIFRQMWRSKTKLKKKFSSSDLPSLNYEAIETVLDNYGKKITSFQNFDKALDSIGNTLFIGEGIVSMILGVICVNFFQYNPPFFLGLLFLIIITLLILKFRAIRALKQYKKDVVKGLFLDFGIATTFKPNSHIEKEDFIYLGKDKEPEIFSGEDYIEGSNGDFHFKFSEVRAKRKLKYFESEIVFQGLYFRGAWDKEPATRNFKLTKTRVKNSSNSTFSTFYDFYDLSGKYLNKLNNHHLLNDTIKEKLLSIAKRHDYRFDIVFKDKEVFMYVYASKDFFEINLKSKFNKKLYMQLVGDVLLFTDLVFLFNFMEEHGSKEDILEI